MVLGEGYLETFMAVTGDIFKISRLCGDINFNVSAEPIDILITEK